MHRVTVTANKHWVCVDIDSHRASDAERRDLCRLVELLVQEWEQNQKREGKDLDAK